MANFTATKAITIFETIEEAVADLETQLEATDDTSVIRTCDVIRVEGTKWASVLIYTAATA